MSIAENIKFDEDFIGSWNVGDADKTMTLIADGAVWVDVNSPEPMRDKAAMRAYVQAWFTAFPNMKAQTKNRVVTDDAVAAEIEFDGTNAGALQMGAGPAMPATGKVVHGKGAYFVKLQGGKAVEVHTYPDVLGMMMQLRMMGGQ